MTGRLKRMIGRFAAYCRNTSANIAMTVALTIVPLLGLLGGSVDVVRATMYAAELRSAVDSAVLAAASLTSGEDADAIARDYIAANMSSDPDFASELMLNIQSSSSLNSRTVTVEATGEMPTFFLGLFNIHSIPISALASANQSVVNIELSLVVDISSSMRGNRLSTLKSSASSFVDQILTDANRNVTSMNFVPFGGTVNVGSAMFNRHAVAEGAAVSDPSESQYDIGQDVLTSSFRFSDGDYCLEHPLSDFNDEAIPNNARGQVPHFWRWWNFHPWCPGANSAVVFNTNDRGDLKQRIANLVLSDGTGMDIGAMWGLKALSPALRGQLGGDFADRPADYDPDQTLKVLVIMTDGAITQQNRPEDYNRFNTHTNRNNNREPNQNSRSNQGNNNNIQTILSRGNTNSGSGSQTAVGQFKAVCDVARSNNIIVFTIGFQIRRNSLPEQMLQYCASDSSRYFLVESLDIQSAFDAIAASVNALRITE